jgi:hypothetical protein
MKTCFKTFSIKRSMSALFLVAASILLLSINVSAQCPATELISGLREPLGTTLTNQGNLLVSENGSTVLHSGRISIVNPANGSRRTLLDGMPCGVSDVNEPSGPHAIVMRGRTLYVAIGTGDVGVAGPIQGTTIPNPNGPSSPIFSSILAIHFSAAVEKNTSGFNLTTANQQALANGQTVTLSKGGGDKITIQLVANFPDYIPFPLPFFPDNIQLSNPFGIELVANKLYVTDGGRNLTWKVNINSGSYSELVSFPGIPNPLFPTFGGPFLEAVPTGIASSGNHILVTLFRGFPFPPGVSTVQQIDPQTGSNNEFITGLRGAIGIMPIKKCGNTSYFVLQHNSGGTILPPFTGPGLLLHFDSPTDPPTLVADCLVRPTSMTLDKKKGKMYVSEHSGRVVVLNISSILAKSGESNESEQTVSIPDDFVLEQNYPNPFNPSTKISYQLPISSSMTLKVYDLMGREVATLVDEYKEAGSYEVKFDASHLSSGIYLYKLNAGEYTSTKKLMLLK